MGTDIHAFLEIDWGSDDEPFTDEGNIRPFNTGEFFLWRNYDLFDALANGRSGNPGLHPRKRPLYPARGIPDVVSGAVADRYYLQVVEPDEDPCAILSEQFRSDPLPGVISRTDADRFVAEGISHVAPVAHVLDDDGPRPIRRQLVSNPDWHHVSWLTFAETDAALDHFRLRAADLKIDTQVLLQTMDLFEQRRGTGRTRLVFWFDN